MRAVRDEFATDVVRDALRNAVENGYTLSHMNNLELAEDLIACGAVEGLEREKVVEAVSSARRVVE